MSKQGLEKIVASLDLCKLIPAGKFEDSALVWHYTDVVGFLCRTSGCEQIHEKQWQIVDNHPRKIAIRRKHGDEIYPALTLAEIFRVLPETIDTPEDEFFVLSLMPVVDDEEDMFWIGYNNTNEEDANPATAALRLWLKLKEIEVK